MMRCFSRTLLRCCNALPGHCIQSPGSQTDKSGGAAQVVLIFHSNLALRSPPRRPDQRSRWGRWHDRNIFRDAAARPAATVHTLGPPDWGSVERWAGGETLQLSIKRILPAHAISPTALAPTALEYSLFLCPGCRTDRVRKPRAAPHMYSPLAAGSGMSRHPASRSASRTWQASRWLPIWLRCTPSST